MTQHTILDDTEWDNTLQNSTDLGQNIIRNKKQRYVYKNKNTTKQMKCIQNQDIQEEFKNTYTH